MKNNLIILLLAYVKLNHTDKFARGEIVGLVDLLLDMVIDMITKLIDAELNLQSTERIQKQAECTEVLQNNGIGSSFINHCCSRLLNGGHRIILMD